MDIEQILALQPDVLIGFGITSENADFQQQKALGIPLIFDAGWMEHHPLGRAEWIKFFGVVTQAQATDSLFETVSEQYQKVIDSLQNVKASPPFFLEHCMKVCGTFPVELVYSQLF